MAMCGADQKLSRPIDRCQEMSQYPPTYAEVTASAAHQRYHGTAAAPAGVTTEESSELTVADVTRTVYWCSGRC